MIARVEKRVDPLTEQTSELRGAYAHLATRQDIAELNGELKGIKAALWLIAAGILPLQVSPVHGPWTAPVIR